MSLKTTADQRQKMYARHQQGETYAELAAAYGLSVGCIRYWCRRQRDGHPPTTSYVKTSPGLLSRFAPIVRYCLLRLRLEHPRWGPQRLRYKLTQRVSLQGQRLPSVAQIGRYLQQWLRFRRRHKRLAATKLRPAAPTHVHQRWLIDFKLGIRLGDGTLANLTSVQDPVGEVCIVARLTPAGRVGRQPRRVTVRELQDAVRAGAARWHTLPEEVQTDNEPVNVGDTQDPFPGLFPLWLAGLGVRHLTIRPGTPTDNAAVERCHQSVCNYALVGCDASHLSHLQQTLEHALDELAFDLPSRAPGCHGQAPVVAHPQLLQPSRLCLPEWELALFDLKRVDAYLATFLWRRTVNKSGQICIGGHHRYYTVGRAYARQDVLVCFDPADRHFVFFQAQAPFAEIGRRPAHQLAVADITGLWEPTAAGIPQQMPLPFMAYQEVSC